MIYRTYGDVVAEVGLTLEKNLRWLVKVVQDSPALDTEAYTRRLQEVGVFAALGDFSDARARQMVAWGLPKKPIQVNLDKFRTLVAQAFEDVLTAGRASIPLHILSCEVFPSPDGSARPWKNYLTTPDKMDSLIQPWQYGLRLCSVLEQCGWRLAKCFGCHHLFLKKRRGQAHCGNRCRSRQFMRDKRAREKQSHQDVLSRAFPTRQHSKTAGTRKPKKSRKR